MVVTGQRLIMSIPKQKSFLYRLKLLDVEGKLIFFFVDPAQCKILRDLLEGKLEFEIDKCLKLTRPHVNRCGECEGCKRTENCGECRSCLDRPEFGGPGLTHKKTCKKRKCQKLVKETENDLEKEIKTRTSGVVTKTFFPRLKF